MPLTKQELEGLSIYDFESFGDDFVGGNLFLGNGFSISLCDRLSYRSLFEEFCNGLSIGDKNLFTAFGTTNFELIIYYLRNAEIVNRILGLPTESVDRLKTSLRRGLISTIQRNHPAHAEIYYPQLANLGEELLEFRDIFTTNYDVFLYKTILQVISEFKDKGIDDPFQDYFYEEISATELGFNYTSVRDIPRSIYYLHGALFLYKKENSSVEYKLRKLEQLRMEYIQLIRREIEHDNFPIFVAEGEAQDKLRAINESPYLTYCSHRLKTSLRNLTVFGFSFGNSDRHIINWIESSRIRRIAISIYVGNKSSEDLRRERLRLINLFANKEVIVFDSTSLFESLQRFY